MTHAIIIRFHYPEGDERFEKRLAYFQAMVLPRLLKQTDQDFDIAIRCNPAHARILKKLSPKIKTFQIKNEHEGYKIIMGKKYFEDFAKWDNVIGLEQYDIQSGLDSDDLISLDYIERIKREVAKRDTNKSLHMSFQPGIFNAMKLTTYPIPVKYDEKRGSAFFSIYQPDKKKYIFAYEHSHLILGKHFEQSIILQSGLCWASVNGNNISTKYEK